jgi:hypothetical protein
LSAVSANEKVLLGEETKRLGEYEGLAEDSEFLEDKTFSRVPGGLPRVLLLVFL